MPNIYANTADGYVISSQVGTWAGARDDNIGSSVNSSNTSTSQFTGVNKFASRGGGATFRVQRSFMFFDTSGITSSVATATIKIRGHGYNDGSVIAVKSTAFGGDGGSALSTTDFDAITGWTTGASASGNVTDYSTAAIAGASWSTSGYNDFTGTSDLKTDMQNNNVVIICFMDYTHDYLNNAIASNGTLNCGGYYANYTGTSRDPYIEYTLAGYANSVNGVASANIGKVNGVATASISKVNGI